MPVIQNLPSNSLAAMSPLQLRQEERRRLPRALLGGTWMMRLEGERYLPREPKEKQAAWHRRLNRTVLKNYYAKTLKSLVGRVFTKPLIVEDTSEDVNTMVENIDLQGNHLNTFAQMLMFNGMNDGACGVFVEMPKRPIDPDTGQAISPTLADMRNGGYRPYFVLVKVNRILGWRASSGPGDPTLQMIRFREDIEVADGEFGASVLERIRVLDMVDTPQGKRCRYRLFEKITDMPAYYGVAPMNTEDPAYGYRLVDDGVTSSDHIPFYMFYANRADFMEAYPALEDLAYLNLMHWQSLSEQRNILHVSRVPILFAKGFEKDEDGEYETSLEVGANIAIYGPADSDMKYVEHNGAAIKSGQDDLDSLEAEMVTFGLEFMMDRPSHESASARVIDHAEVNSPLKIVAHNLTDTLENALKDLVVMIGETQEPSVKTAGELGLSLKDSATITNLIEARKNGMLSLKTFLDELKRASFLCDDVDTEAEAKEILKELAEKQTQALEIAQIAADAKAQAAQAAPGATGGATGATGGTGGTGPAPRPPQGGGPVPQGSPIPRG